MSGPAFDALAAAELPALLSVNRLSTDRLILRRLEPEDLDDLVELDSDPEVMRYLSGGVPTPRETLAQKFPQWIDERLAAIEKASGRFIGWFELRGPSPDSILELAPGDLELGYRLRREYWGRGYATEGSLALIAAGFEQHGASRVVATTMAVNKASRRVMEKAGLAHIGTFHLDWADPIEGAEAGDVLYAVTREAWRQR